MFDRIDDTIVAISSPPGSSARAIIRLSGPRAFELAARVFRITGDFPHRALQTLRGYERHIGGLELAQDVHVAAEAYTFRTPVSYTKQDLVELHTIGSPPVLSMILDQLTASGARVAEPGEFTGRAFLAGNLDLPQVEGVAAMIHSQSDAQLRAAQLLLRGELSRRTTVLRDQIADHLALVEAEIDFAEEPIEFISPALLVERLKHVADEISQLLQGSDSAERLDILPRVAFIGPPNAGKSTLFNALTGMDRAIRSAIAGTTRDVLTAPVQFESTEALLLDTAGLSTDLTGLISAHELQLAEQMQSATLRALATADLVILVLDITDDPANRLIEVRRQVGHHAFKVVLNKIDLLAPEPAAPRITCIEGHEVLSQVSAEHGLHIDHLRQAIVKNLCIHAEKQAPHLLALSSRQRRMLGDAHAAMGRALSLIEIDAPPPGELLALELREAMHALSLLSGEVTTEELLGRIFSRFCIGK